MHSRYRISNSSDAFNLDLGVPAIQKLNSEKHTEEVRIYCEPTVECQRLKNLDENRLSSTTETLLVEPHYINLLFTPLTQEFLAQEKRRKVKAEGGQTNNNNEISQLKVKDESKPVSFSKLERLKSLDKKSSKENVKDEKKIKEPAIKKPPDLFSPAAGSKSLHLPKLAQLPRTPIPASELPPNSVRMPPKALSSVIPAALSSLSPIPLKDLNKPGGLPMVSSGAGLPPPPPQTTSITTSGGLISIQVPLKGADGTTIMQTINVPKSVLAGASERPVLLTVTPKNGINKGQKQIVMLTKNASGFGVSMRTLQPGESPSKVMLSQRPGLAGAGAGPPASTSTTSYLGASGRPAAGGRFMNQHVSTPGLAAPGLAGLTAAPGLAGLTANKPDINALLSQVKPIPTKELANKVASNVYPGVNTKSVISVVNSPVGSIGSGGTGTPVSSALPPQPRAIYLQQQAQTSIGTSARHTTISQAPPQSSTTRTIVNRQVIQQLIRPGGQLIGNGQQLILQDGKRVILQQAPRPSSLDQVPGAGRIVLTQKGQVLQGAQAQALAGKIINTSQGQFIVGPNGQLQKLVQNNMNSQTVRYITISQPNSISGSSQLINTSAHNIVAGGSGQVYGLQSQVPVSLQLGGVNQQGQIPGVQQARMPGVQQARMPGIQQGQLSGVQQTRLPGVQQIRLPGIQQGQLPGVQTFTSMGSQGAAINEGLGSRITQLAGVQGGGVGRSTAVLVPVGSVANMGQKIFTTQARTSQMTTTTAGSSTPGRVTVAIPIMQGGSNSPGVGGGTTMMLNTPSPGSLPESSRFPGSGVTGGTTIMTQLGTGTSPISLLSSPAGISPVLSTGVRNLTTGPGSSTSIPLSSLGPGLAGLSGSAGVPGSAGLPGSAGIPGSATNQKSTSAFNQMFLNALSNRGLLSQQNGKFVYVGDKSKTVVSQGQSSLSSVPIPVTNIMNSPGVSQYSGIPGGVPHSGIPGGTPLSGIPGGTPLSGIPGGTPHSGSPGMLTTPPTVSINPSDVTPDKNIVQVVVSAPNLDSFTASPRLLRMASSLMENPTIAELINTPCENSDSMTQNLNGDINLYGVKPLEQQVGQSPAICDTSAWGGGTNSTPTTTKPKMTKPRTFYYRDPRLPTGWYVSVDIIPGSAIITNYFTGNGEKLRSLSEVAHYLKNKLVLLPSCKAIRLPRPLKDMPALQDLSPENKACVKELILPVVDETSPLIRQIETEIITSVGQHNAFKRSGSNLPNQVEHKKSKIVFL